MSRIWDVDGIEWEDLPTVSDLLCAADIAHCCLVFDPETPGGRVHA